ncbi:hypothetical protein AT959_02535 [Dechloromonas denitrificans]|uniref:Uncharacterized protein n=1 Tax=Dechloromonas denitrificans TaxID=281362 RepID=A0A133XNR0_9RHOO|nr:hypothetical protein AT959_02535 [Dechloromonas denitrificans]
MTAINLDNTAHSRAVLSFKNCLADFSEILVGRSERNTHEGKNLIGGKPFGRCDKQIDKQQ